MGENLSLFHFFACLLLDNALKLEDCYKDGRACICSGAGGVYVRVRLAACAN